MNTGYFYNSTLEHIPARKQVNKIKKSICCIPL